MFETERGSVEKELGNVSDLNLHTETIPSYLPVSTETSAPPIHTDQNEAEVGDQKEPAEAGQHAGGVHLRPTTPAESNAATVGAGF